MQPPSTVHEKSGDFNQVGRVSFLGHIEPVSWTPSAVTTPRACAVQPAALISEVQEGESCEL
jgi:hypothetical protein